MLTDMATYRQLGTRRFELDREITQDVASDTLLRGESRLGARLRGWFSGKAASPEHTVAAQQVKTAFFNVLARSEGEENARRALGRAGLGSDWKASAQPLTSRTIAKVMDSAQEYRVQVMRQNDRKLNAALAQLKGPRAEAGSRDLCAAVRRAIGGHPEYGQRVLSDHEVRDRILKTKQDVRDREETLCAERFPGLTALLKVQGKQTPEAPINVRTLVNQVRDTLAGSVAADPQVGEALTALDTTTGLLARQAWTQADMRVLEDALEAQKASVDNLVGQLDQVVAGLAPTMDELKGLLAHQQDMQCRRAVLASTEGQLQPLQARHALLAALREDLSQQAQLLEGKQAYVQELRGLDPLSEAAVAHSNLMWQEVGLVIMLAQRENQPKNGAGIIIAANLIKAAGAWRPVALDAASRPLSSPNAVSRDTNNVGAPVKKNDSSHPVVQGKLAMLEKLRQALKDAGLSEAEVRKATSNAALKQAQRHVLNQCQDWQPVSRTLQVTRDGATRDYLSKITPAQHIPALTRVYTDPKTQRPVSVSSGSADSADHARNLKVSELFQGERRLATVVGHGVLDMWKISDPVARTQANKAGAQEVLTAAAATNPRLMEALGKSEGPAQVTHVSVNLISPDNLRSLPGMAYFLPDYTEKTYTNAQFEAFAAVKNVAVSPPVASGSASVNVDVDTITFSFGVNAIATNPVRSQLMGGVWRNVHAHNTENMIKFIGDLGQGSQGARGTPPGGFVGQIYDKLAEGAAKRTLDDGARAELDGLMHKLRVQTDTVRQMFTDKTFADGKGDPAKMGREILALQALAESSLDALHQVLPAGDKLGTDRMAATMSKGCKSDKDRGGVTDAELKTKLILQDMGGDMVPDVRLAGDDQKVYYDVSAAGGQLDVQRWNTGLSGNKEAGHLKDRLPDLQVRAFLKGLSVFAAS